MVILVVEDHEDSRRATCTLLSLQGHKVLTACDGETALAEVDRAIQHGEPPVDVALIDLNLPGMSGMQLLARLRERYPLRCLALSGMVGRQEVAAALRAGFDQHLAKPISFEELEKALVSCNRTEPAGG